MAKVQVLMPDDFLVNLADLGNRTDEIVESMLDVGGKIVLEAVRKNLQSAIGRNVSDNTEVPSSGELLDSLGVTSPKVDNEGNHNVKVGFNEPRRYQNKAKGKRSYYERTNAMVANTLEYGVKGRQQPRPYMRPAKRQSERECVQAMKDKFESQVGTL